MSAQIVQLESTSTEHAQFSQLPSAHKYVKCGLGEVSGSVQSLITRLRSHEATIGGQLESLFSGDGWSDPVATQFARLQQVKESISHCVQIVSDAKESSDERSNVFEHITLADNGCTFSVSTVNDLIIARRPNSHGRSWHFGGSIADETVQRSIYALAQLNAKYLKHEDRNGPNSSSNARQFRDRFGPGRSLSERGP